MLAQSFNVLLEHIPGKANSAADFLLRLQTDSKSTLQIKLTDHVPIREIEIETEAKAPIFCLLNIFEITTFSEDIQHVVDVQFIDETKAHGLYDQFLAKQTSNNPDFHFTGLLSLSSIPQVNLIETNNFQELLNDLQKLAGSLDKIREQQDDEVIGEVISWKNQCSPDGCGNLSIALRKYRKQFEHLVVENDIL